LERFDFLPVEGEKLFTVTHEPEEGLGGSGVLILHPFAEEKLWVGRATTRLARAMAAAGLPVCRFDFRGHGDSDRDHHEMSLGTLAADARAAAAHLRERCGITELHLFGFRLGGTLALQFASELEASSVALVAPLPAGESYLLKVLRSNLTTQMGIHGEVRKDRQALLGEMRETGLLNIDGYHLSAGLFDELSSLDFDAAPPGFRGPGLVLSLLRREGAPADPDSRKVFEAALAAHQASRLETLVYPALWAEQKRFAVGDAVLFDPLTAWCGGGWRETAS